VQLDHKGTKILVTGASGMGKSTYWTRLLIGYPARTKFVFDHEQELQIRLRIQAVSDPAGLAQAAAAGWCVFDPERMFGGDLQRAFDFFASFAFEASSRLPGVKLFAVDEVQEFVGNHTISQPLNNILKRGRRRGLDSSFATHAPNEIHNAMRQQLTEVVSFAHADPLPLEWLRGYGFDSAELRALPPLHFVCRRRGALSQVAGSLEYDRAERAPRQ
jgi:hypothetical protein